MSNTPRIYSYDSLGKLVTRLRDDLNSKDFVLLFAYNGTGKTRLSMEFKEAGKQSVPQQMAFEDGTPMTFEDGSPFMLEDEAIISDTLYFNAYTEDLFHWHNDFESDTERKLLLNSESKFFKGFEELDMENKIRPYLQRYAKFDFEMHYEEGFVRFFKDDSDYIKVSRGEENIFIWSVYMALCELVIDEDPAYSWVKYLYIDDPISSLDENNAVIVATDLAKLLRSGKDKVKAIISSHHSLFFNVMFNEMKRTSHKKYFLYRSLESDIYTIRATDETPFFHHVAMLSELKQVQESGKIFTYHFNTLRAIMEKTAVFFGYNDFSACIHGLEDRVLFERSLQLFSHGKYSVFQPVEMGDDTKELFVMVLSAFLDRYEFQLPEILNSESEENGNDR